VENIHYENVDGGSFDDCGFTIDFESTNTGHFMVREVEGSDGQAFLGHDNVQFRNVLTNPETGAFMVVRGHGSAGTCAVPSVRSVEGISGPAWSPPSCCPRPTWA
jgi:hypothetical protein